MATIQAKHHRTKSGTEFIVRSATTADADNLILHALATMSETDFNVTTPDEFKMTVEQEAAWIANIQSAPADLALIAEMNGQMAGFLNFSARRQRRVAHVGAFGMGVRKQAWDLGIGSALLQTLIDWAKAQPQLRKITLEVLANNARAIALYQRMGFAVEGRRKNYIHLGKGEFVDDLIMALDV